MKGYRYVIVYVVLVLVQIVLCNFLNLSRFAVLSFLPALVLMLPLRWNDIPMMAFAFALGFVVDFFSTGMLGLTSVALVPVALARGLVIAGMFGDELGAREGELGISRFGIPKFILAMLLLCALYFLVYVWADSAGTMGFWQCVLRFFLSVLVSTPVCLFVATILRPE
ncbi:MAG: hypothetical protein IK031_00590 [Bacteroidales bacterium]|nr:hypothetical protein [Bacteroidales bacterium]